VFVVGSVNGSVGAPQPRVNLSSCRAIPAPSIGGMWNECTLDSGRIHPLRLSHSPFVSRLIFVVLAERYRDGEMFLHSPHRR